jgi:tRNA threonylcarbamoyladenosine biosynthesis protein TsaB
MSLVLLLNTCGAEGIVALAEDGHVRSAELLPGRGTSEHLMPAIRLVLGGLRVAELAAVGVVVGPGSFTGVRVGLSAAKGLCEAARVGMVAMSRLELVAAGADCSGYVVALLDGGRGEFYCGAYRGGERISERLVRRDEALAAMKHGTAVTCEARVAEALGDRVRVVEEPGAEAMLTMVEARMRSGEWSDVATVDANYLRRTDAELAAEKR